mgnify:CR=1 FL=1
MRVVLWLVLLQEFALQERGITSSFVAVVVLSPRTLPPPRTTTTCNDPRSRLAWSKLYDTAANNKIHQEINQVEYQLSLIEALQERNKAQLDSFIDEQDQWDSMEDSDQELLSSEEELITRLAELRVQLEQESQE